MGIFNCFTASWQQQLRLHPLQRFEGEGGHRLGGAGKGRLQKETCPQVSGRRCQLGVKSEQGDQLLRDEREREGFHFLLDSLGKKPWGGGWR